MSWLSAAIGAVGDMFATNQANAANAAALEKQMAFNREVMQNRHQWEVQDLRAAGLNPLMSTTSPTGTLSAPNSSPAQKANFAQSAAALANINIADKQAEAALNSSKADLHNAKTNEINANTAAAAQQEEVRKNQNDFRVASEQLYLGFRELDVKKALAKADIDLKAEQQIRQRIENDYLPHIMKAELDYKVQEILLQAQIAAATVEKLYAEGRAADAAAYASYSQANLNAKIGQLTDVQKDSLSAQAERDAKDYEKSSIARDTQLARDIIENDWINSEEGEYFTRGSHYIQAITGTVTPGLRIGKRFGLHSNNSN